MSEGLRQRLGVRRRLRQLRYSLGFEPEHVVEYLGRPFAYPDGSLIGDYVASANEWDTILRVIADTVLPSEPVICEVGSNIGASIMQIFAARPRAHVVAIEPSDRFRRFLIRNLEAAGHKDTEVLSLALGEEVGTRVLHNNASTASISNGQYDGHEARGKHIVQVATLDRLWAGRDRMDLLKIDTDGHELAVLKGASETLRRHHPLVFIELAPHLVGDGVGTVRILHGAGYERFACLSPFPESSLIGISENADEIVSWAEAQTFLYCDVVTWSPAAEYAPKMEPMLREAHASNS